MTLQTNLRIDQDRLVGRLEALGEIGALPGGGVCRLALSDEDRQGRDRVVGWMRELGLKITIDRLGNVIGVREGTEDGPPVVMGSHIDTVATGGLYDGALGVLGGLEVISVLNDAGITTRRPVAVAFFTNEEGSRFHPDMVGSAVQQGKLDLDAVLATVTDDGTTVAEDLARIGYAGEAPCDFRAHAYFELHIEQGPVLDGEGLDIGAVTGVQGIYWTEYRIFGTANHAGTTPMAMRHDAGFVAAALAVEARKAAGEAGGNQVTTVGRIVLTPGLTNVVPKEAVIRTDLRNIDGDALIATQKRLEDFLAAAAADEGCTFEIHELARFAPQPFDPAMVDRVERTARDLGYAAKRMPSGAGHDAQMFAPNCPTAMVFVPNKDGISHNTTEYAKPDDIGAGANVLLNVVLETAS